MKLLFAAVSVLACLLCSCGVQDRTVRVTNGTAVDRQCETVSVPFDRLGLKDLTADGTVVSATDGSIVPCQTVTEPDGSLTLIFQTNLKAGESAEFTVSKGVRQPCDTLARSRYVPERMDDYAYENNVIVGRIYGPALASPRTFGPDVWIKNTSRFVFDDWLALRDFHRNHGEGMDCYMVGSALGGGACAPVAGDKVCIGDNYLTWRRLSNGPIRTEAQFTYPVIDVDGIPVTTLRSLSLDASSRLVRWTTAFEAEGVDSLDVVVGAALHDVISIVYGEDYISFTEWASDSKLDDPHLDGKISIGLIIPDRFKAEACELDGHAVLKFRVKCGETVEYWTASGWDRGGVESPESWNAYMKDRAFAVNHPLEVSVVR